MSRYLIKRVFFVKKIKYLLFFDKKKLSLREFSHLTYIIMNEQENTVSFFRFEDLRIYAKTLDYITWLYKNLSAIPAPHQLSLEDPFLRSAQSIGLHLAEGSARNKTQFIYYLKMAKSAVRECVVYTEIVAQMNFWDNDQKDYSRNQLMELTKMIGSLISSLQRSLSSSRDEDDADDSM